MDKAKSKRLFLESYDGSRRIGNANGRRDYAACFTTIAGIKKTYDLKSMVNLLCNPPSNFTPDDRKMASDALERIALRNFGLDPDL